MSGKLKLELVWWVVTAVVVSTVMFPIWRGYPEFGFRFLNVVFIVVFVTFTRYIFLLRYTFLAERQYVKIGMILFSLLITLTLIVQMNDFQRYVSEHNLSDMLRGVVTERQEALWGYIKTEFVLFAMGSIVASIVLPARLMMSVWRVSNHEGI